MALLPEDVGEVCETAQGPSVRCSPLTRTRHLVPTWQEMDLQESMSGALGPLLKFKRPCKSQVSVKHLPQLLHAKGLGKLQMRVTTMHELIEGFRGNDACMQGRVPYAVSQFTFLCRSELPWVRDNANLTWHLLWSSLTKRNPPHTSCCDGKIITY